MSTDTTLSIVILSWNTASMTCKCISSLLNHQGQYALEIIVIDNDSQDGSADRIAQEFPTVKLVRNRTNRLYAAANNQGVELASGKWLCLLNSDTEVQPGALDQLVNFLSANLEYIIASPRLLNFDNTIQKACKRFPKLTDPLFNTTFLSLTPIGKKVMATSSMQDFDHNHDADVDQPPGTCMVMKTADFREIGGFDEMLSLYFNDVDFCLKAKNTGRKIRFLASASIYHHEGASTAKYKRVTIGNPLFFINRKHYYKKRFGLPGYWFCIFCIYLLSGEIFFRLLLGKKDKQEKTDAIKTLWQDFKWVNQPYTPPD